MAKPESKFWQEVKKSLPDISFTRIENLSSLGTPDVLCQNKNGTFFTLELKVTKTNSVRISPHQISFHIRHPKNTFILVKPLAPSLSKLSDKNLAAPYLYEGSRCLQLATQGLRLAPLAKGYEACRLKLQSL
jgi:hypothetical protein